MSQRNCVIEGPVRSQIGRAAQGRDHTLKFLTAVLRKRTDHVQRIDEEPSTEAITGQAMTKALTQQERKVESNGIMAGDQ